MTLHDPARQMHHRYCSLRLGQVSSGASLMPSTPDQQVIDAITDGMCLFPSQWWPVVPQRISQSEGRDPAPCKADELSRPAGIFLPDEPIPSVAPSPLSPALAGIRRAEKDALVSAFLSAASCAPFRKTRLLLLTGTTNDETWRFDGGGSRAGVQYISPVG